MQAHTGYIDKQSIEDQRPHFDGKSRTGVARPRYAVEHDIGHRTNQQCCRNHIQRGNRCGYQRLIVRINRQDSRREQAGEKNEHRHDTKREPRDVPDNWDDLFFMSGTNAVTHERVCGCRKGIDWNQQDNIDALERELSGISRTI